MKTDITPAQSPKRLLWVTYLAFIWSTFYAILGIYWMLGGAGFPFGANDPEALVSPLKNLTVNIGAPIIAALGFLGALIAILLTRDSVNKFLQITFQAFAFCIAAICFLVIPDYRLLAGLAYTPVLVLGAPFNWFSEMNLLDVFPWPVVNQIICVLGGYFWVATAIIFRRRIIGACVYCGRNTHGNSWTKPYAATKWGKWATYIAVVIPLIYAFTRYAWALGIPLGITAEFFQQGQDNGIWYMGAGLATVAVCGSILTLGLIRPWGETFPAWMFGLAGKTVPPALAFIPAALVAVIITSAGMNFFWLIFSDTSIEVFTQANWAALVPELFWPFWGISLAIATLAYYYRRRGRCIYCGMIE